MKTLKSIAVIALSTLVTLPAFADLASLQAEREKVVQSIEANGQVSTKVVHFVQQCAQKGLIDREYYVADWESHPRYIKQFAEICNENLKQIADHPDNLVFKKYKEYGYTRVRLCQLITDNFWNAGYMITDTKGLYYNIPFIRANADRKKGVAKMKSMPDLKAQAEYWKGNCQNMITDLQAAYVEQTRIDNEAANTKQLEASF